MNDLLANLDAIHSTDLGVKRIEKNLALSIPDVTAWCKSKIDNAYRINRIGKNYYVRVDDIVLTINAHSFTIITARKKKSNKLD